jgi:Xaa-Pro aminopeptidase
VALWKAGLDYQHGTGHGVGSYLSVHEGPQRIAKSGTEKLLAGMILSNEPGYYKEGAYGIRMENLILVTEAEEVDGGDIAMHGFQTLTLAPFDRRLVKPELLTSDELDWLNAYHARVLSEVGPLVDGETLKWLEAATAPIG